MASAGVTARGVCPQVATTEPGLLSSCPVFPALSAHAESVKATHLRDLMRSVRPSASRAPRPRLTPRRCRSDEARCSGLVAEHNGIVLDISRQKVTTETMGLLSTLFAEQEVAEVSEAHPPTSAERAAR